MAVQLVSHVSGPVRYEVYRMFVLLQRVWYGD
jgi:hypothetical protein